MKAFNYWRICHARVLAERLDPAPICGLNALRRVSGPVKHKYETEEILVNLEVSLAGRRKEMAELVVLNGFRKAVAQLKSAPQRNIEPTADRKPTFAALHTAGGTAGLPIALVNSFASLRRKLAPVPADK